MATKTINTRILIRNDVAADWTAANPVLKQGEIGIETDTHKIKIGDDNTAWNSLPYAYKSDAEIDSLIAAAEDNFTEIVPNDGETDAQALARVITAPSKGDIAVIKRTFATDKHSYTGYVYNGTDWGAMDGNYNAENVYIDGDIIVTTQIGTIQTLTNGSATWSTDGKNLKQALMGLVAEEKQPTATLPTANFKTYSGIANQTVEPGTDVSGTVSYELQLATVGSYTYGPATGVTASGAYSITYDDGTTAGQTKSTKSGSFDYSFTVGTSNKQVKVTASSVGYKAATANAKTNLGNATSVTIAAGSASAGTKTNTFTSSRKSFWAVDNTTGTSLSQADATAKATTSNMIRNLANSAFGTKTSYSLAIPAGTKRVIIAVPGTKTMSSCIDVDGMGLDVKSNFVATTGIKVGGADSTSSDIGDYAADYTVFVCENGAGLAKTTYNITLA